MGKLDGLTILRYGHMYDGGGGMEQYVADLNRILMTRSRTNIIQVQLTSDPARVGENEETTGHGKFTRVSLFVEQKSHERAIAGSPANGGRIPRLKHWVRDRLVSTSSPLAGRLLASRRIPKRDGEPDGAGETVRAWNRRYPLDLICLHSAGGADASEILDVAEAEGIPVVYIHHFSNDRLSGLSIRAQADRLRCVGGVCEVDVPAFLKGRFHRVADGVDTAFFQRSAARPLRNTYTAPIIFLPARITPAKGQEDLIRVAGDLHRLGLDFHLVMAGRTDDPAFLQQLQELAGNLGLREKIHFPGQLGAEDLRDWYAAAAIVAFPTRHHEGLPRILLEAQAMGVPPVAYEIGGTADGLKDGETGFLVKLGDRDGLLARVKQLLEDQDMRSRMGMAARSFIEERFSLETLAQRHEQFYVDAIATPQHNFEQRAPLKDSLYRLAAKMPDSVNAWLCGEECLLPYYHMVSDERLPHVSPLYRFRNVQEFKADLDQLLSGRRALSASEFMDAVRTTGSPPARSFLLTFDDGFREMHDVVAPILISKGVPAIFFLTSATVDNRDLCHHQKISLLLNELVRAASRFPHVEVLRILTEHGIDGSKGVASALKAIPWRLGTVVDDLGRICGVDFAAYRREKNPHLTSEQIRSLLDRGFEIGAHSVDHPRYTDLTLAEQLAQTRESMMFLEKQFDLRRRLFAFPHTDRGVSREFFDMITGEDGVEATFGTSAPARDCCPRSFQRFSMEKTDLPASAILAGQRLRILKLRASGRMILKRPSQQVAGRGNAVPQPALSR